MCYYHSTEVAKVNAESCILSLIIGATMHLGNEGRPDRAIVARRFAIDAAAVLWRPAESGSDASPLNRAQPIAK